jgi:hypothetical protein
MLNSYCTYSKQRDVKKKTLHPEPILDNADADACGFLKRFRRFSKSLLFFKDHLSKFVFLTTQAFTKYTNPALSNVVALTSVLKA